MVGHTVVGTGPEKVVVLHGWFGDYTVFNAMIPYLDTERFTYVFMDYRGYGTSKDQAGEHSLAEICSDALALTYGHGWERFHVLGHSMGGKAAQWLAALAPARVKSVIALTPVPASAVPFDEQQWAFFGAAADSPETRGAIMALTTGNRLSKAWERAMIATSMATTTRDAFAAYLQAWVRTDFAAEVQGSVTPIKVIVGETDAIITVGFMQATLMQWFKHAELEVIANAGHYPMVETPAWLATTCEAFFAKHVG